MTFPSTKAEAASVEATQATIEPGVPAASTAKEVIDPGKDYFSTEHLLSNLHRRTVSGGVVTISAQIAKFALNLISTVVLARLLTPADFGMLAMVGTILAFLQVFKDAGLSTATIQCERLNHSQVSNLFWVNVGLGGILCALAVIAAPAIAWFYNDPRLTAISVWLSVTYLLNGSTVQHRALLKRQMRFKAIALIDIGSMVVSLITGISMALLGCGYWSLVGMSIAYECIGVILTWFASSWRPQFIRSGVGTKQLLGFGANLTAAGFIYYLSSSMDTLLLGRRYGSEAVGLYSRAMALLMRPLDLMLSPISAVFVPALSRLQNEQERYRRAFLQLYEAIALVGFSVTGLLLALSHPLTLILLGRKWEATATIFAGFTVSALYAPLAISATWLFTSQGRGRETLVNQCILSSLAIASFVVGLPFGPVGVATAFAVSGICVRLPILYHFVGKRGPVRTIDLWSVFLRHLPVWMVSFGVTFLTRTFLVNFGSVSQVAICAPVTLVALAAFVLISQPQRRVARNLWQLAHKSFAGRFSS